MDLLGKFTDASLKRIYKFILKRSIGRYLKDDLVMEQLNVNSRSGEIFVSDLELDNTQLNEDFLSSQPFRIISATVKLLDARLSYALLSGEGSLLSVNGVEIVI